MSGVVLQPQLGRLSASSELLRDATNSTDRDVIFSAAANFLDALYPVTRHLRGLNRVTYDTGRLTEQIWDGLDAQTVVVPGAAAAERVLPGLAAQLLQLFDERERIARDVEEVLDAHPLAEILTSMPGVGVKIAARLLAEIGSDVSDFATAAHLAAYAGLAPVTRRSGTSIRGEHASRSGNRRLKNAHRRGLSSHARPGSQEPQFGADNKVTGQVTVLGREPRRELPLDS